MKTDNLPDKTLSEIADSDEHDHVTDKMVDDDEAQEEINEMKETAIITAGAVVLNTMLEDDALTLRKYGQLMNWIAEYEQEHGTGRL